MYGILNTLSEYTYLSIPKTITLYTFLLVFKIIASLQRILKHSFIFKIFWTDDASNCLDKAENKETIFTEQIFLQGKL